MKHGFDTDFELNIAPIVDCLTVLITYLLASATFISLGMMSVTLPSFNDEFSPADRPEVTLTIQILQNKTVSIVSEGADSSKHRLGGTGPQQMAALKQYLQTFKSRFPKLDGVVVSAEDSVE